MNNAKRRIMAILLALVLVAGLTPAMGGTKRAQAAASVDDYRKLKAGGGKVVTNITTSKTMETLHLYLSAPSKVTFRFSTDLSSGANITIKKGIEFAMVDSQFSVKNAETRTIEKYLSVGDYYIAVGREGMGESGKITTSCTAKALDMKNDRPDNSTLQEATDFSELTAAKFKGSFLFDDTQDVFKITFQDRGNLQFCLESLTDNSGFIKAEVGPLDPSGDLIPSYSGECSKTSDTKPSMINFNQSMEPGTYYIRLTSATPGEYRFSSKNITASISSLTVKKTVTLKAGKTTNLIKAIKPSGATGQIRVKIADDSKVELLNTNKGKIKALKVGKTTVSFTVVSTGKRYTSTVTVKK